MGRGLLVTAKACFKRQNSIGFSEEGRFRAGMVSGRNSYWGLRLGHPWTLPILLYFFLFLLSPASVKADCECGYSTSIGATGSSKQQYVFTDLIETNFFRLRDISLDTDWVRQEFNISKETARGDYGEMFLPDNVEASPQGTGNTGNTGAKVAAGQGLQLLVKSNVVDGMVPVAEIDTNRLDLAWGTFRASMKMTDVPGTCAAFFWVGLT